MNDYKEQEQQQELTEQEQLRNWYNEIFYEELSRSEYVNENETPSIRI